MYRITMPEGKDSKLNGSIHDELPLVFYEGVAYTDVEYFPSRWLQILTIMVGEPIVEEVFETSLKEEVLFIPSDALVEVVQIEKKRRGRKCKIDTSIEVVASTIHRLKPMGFLVEEI